ncbi:MAG: outer membrane protein assembly factor BamB [Gammaproteobacteria bacterium]
MNTAEKLPQFEQSVIAEATRKRNSERIYSITHGLFVIFTCAMSVAATMGQTADLGLAQFYGQVPWASVHRDSRNSDFSPLVTTTKIRKSWSVLDGAALINPGVIDIRGNHYVTSGRGAGYSHLHAFDANGISLWESPVQIGEDDLDAMAGFNAPVIDEEGDIYIGDGNQFWAFHSDGELKWVSLLPEPGKPFVYQIISKQGYVGGITVDGKVLFYHRQDGKLALPIFRLPAGVAPARGPALPGLWQGGLFHESVIELFKQIAFGYQVQVANAPAVHPETGRVFITAAGAKSGDDYSGVLYGLDINESGVEIAFATKMGGGSGTSPALSSDGSIVYSADGDGQMLAVDTHSGEIVWAAKGEGLLSPAIADDGTILTGNIFAAPTVIALNPEDGTNRWARSYDDYAATLLPTLAPQPPEFLSGKPVARLVSVISASADTVWVGMNLGYDYHQPGTGLTLPVPHKTVVCALRPVDGELLECLEVRDTVEGMINIGTAGRLSVSHTSIFGSFFYYGLNSKLPERFRSPMIPVGGLTAMEPHSYCQQAQLEIDRVKHLLANLNVALSSNNVSSAIQFSDKSSMQLSVMEDTLDLANATHELSDGKLSNLRNNIRSSLQDVRNLRTELQNQTNSDDQTFNRIQSLLANSAINHISPFCLEK